MAVIQIDTQAKRDAAEERLEVLERLSERAANVRALVARAAEAEAQRDLVGARVRAGLVRDFPALDGVLETPLTDLQIVRDGSGDIVEVRTNGDVQA